MGEGVGGAGPLHVVQVGSDDAVFSAGAAGEPLRRQVEYGRILDRLRPGARMTLLVATRNPSARPFTEENVTFAPYTIGAGGVGRLRGWVRLVGELARLHRASPIGVVTTQSVHDEAWAVLHFARRARVPVVGQVHYDLFSPAAQADQSGAAAVAWARFALTKRALPRFAAVRVVGERIRTEIVARGLNRRVANLPVPMSLVAGSAITGQHERPPKVLFVGRFCAQKNLPGWLEVAARVAREVPEARFVLAGAGELLGEVRAGAARHGIADRVELPGFVAYDALPALYRAARVFLLTSHYEGFGRVVAEAGSQGVPVVAPRITGVEDIVEDGETGFLHPPGDAAAMAESVVRLLRDPARAAAMGARAEASVRRRFDPARMAEAWMRLLVDAAGEGARPSS